MGSSGSLSDDDDDFGDFSDASFEATALEIDDRLVDNAIDGLFGDSTVENLQDDKEEGRKYQLTDLLSDERPNVIYHALVDTDGRDILPFIWNQSNLRSAVLNILRIRDPLVSTDSQEDDAELRNTTVDDSLFMSIMTLIDDSSIALNPHVSLLKEKFNISFVPHITHLSLQEDYKREQTSNIPDLVGENIDSVTNMKDYHDQLCNIIDQLIVELKELKSNEMKLNEDKKTFEHVVTNLSGHTQRLQRDEIALFNKKKHNNNKWHRFSWVGK